MPASKWRIIWIETRGGGDLELSELQLYSGAGAVYSRVDTSATFTCTAPPLSGSLLDLTDDLTTAVARFDASAPGFAFEWDFGASEVEIALVRMGSSASEGTFPDTFALQYRTSSTAAWVTKESAVGTTWPGPSAMLPMPTASTFRDTVMGLGPAAYYRLGETTGTTAVDETGAFSGTYVNNPVRGVEGLIFGDANAAVRLNPAQGQYIDVTYARNLADRSLSTSIFALVRPRINTSNVIVSTKRSDASFGDVLFYIDGAGRCIVQVNHLGVPPYVTQYSGASRLPPGGAYAVCAVLDQSQYRVYVGGVLDGAFDATWSGGPGYFSDVEIGRHQNYVYGNSYFDGEVDEVVFFNRALTAAEVLSLTESLGAWAPTARQTRRSGLGFAEPMSLSGGAVGDAVLLGAEPAAQSDVQDGGRGRIAGTVKEKAVPDNTPLRRRVRLIHQRSGRLVRETWSDAATGTYSFDWINAAQVYVVEAFDHTGMYRAVIADNLTPEPMP